MIDSKGLEYVAHNGLYYYNHGEASKYLGMSDTGFRRRRQKLEEEDKIIIPRVILPVSDQMRFFDKRILNVLKEVVQVGQEERWKTRLRWSIQEVISEYNEEGIKSISTHEFAKVSPERRAKEIIEKLVMTSIDPPARYVMPADATEILEKPMKAFYDESLEKREGAILEMAGIALARLTRSASNEEEAKEALEDFFQQMQNAAKNIASEKK